MPRKRPDAEHLIDEKITRQIIGAFFECYNILDYGQFESVYRKALLHEMNLRGLTASEEIEVGLLLHFGHEPRFERCINAELFISERRRPREDDPASSGESG